MRERDQMVDEEWYYLSLPPEETERLVLLSLPVGRNRWKWKW